MSRSKNFIFISNSLVLDIKVINMVKLHLLILRLIFWVFININFANGQCAFSADLLRQIAVSLNFYRFSVINIFLKKYSILSRFCLNQAWFLFIHLIHILLNNKVTKRCQIMWILISFGRSKNYVKLFLIDVKIQ